VVLQDCGYPLTHSLTVLTDLCVELDESLRADVAPAVWLTQFAVRFRYPGNPEDPDVEDATGGLANAKRVVESIGERVQRRG
jgi:hypothetical protein